MVWVHLAKLPGYISFWYIIGNTDTYGQSYPVEWYSTKEAATKAIHEHNKAFTKGNKS
jgi:hypothetical protein